MLQGLNKKTFIIVSYLEYEFIILGFVAFLAYNFISRRQKKMSDLTLQMVSQLNFSRHILYDLIRRLVNTIY